MKLLVLLSTLFVWGVAHSSAHSSTYSLVHGSMRSSASCGSPQPIKELVDQTSWEGHLQSLHLDFSEFVLAQGLIYKSRDQDWRRAPVIKHGLEDLVLLLNKKRSVSGSALDSPFSREMARVLKRYPNVEQRTGDPKGYFAQLVRLLRQFPQGPRWIRCYENLPVSPKIPSLKFTESNNAFMQFAYLQEDVGNTSNVLGQLRVSLRMDPVQGLIALGHELEHACTFPFLASLHQARHETEKLLAKATRSEKRAAAFRHQLRELRTQEDQISLFDEMNAYEKMVEAFTFLEKEVPRLTCSSWGLSLMWGMRVERLSVLYSDMQRRMASGEFAEFMAKDYVAAGFWKEENIFQIETGRLRPDLLERLKGGKAALTLSFLDGP